MVLIRLTGLNGIDASVYGELMIRTFLMVIFLLAGCAEQSGPPAVLLADRATLCPAETADAPPDFTGASCQDIDYRETDPQDGPIWLRVHIDAPERVKQGVEPAGVYVSAKASSRVYFNGRLLGENGVPALNKADEQPGAMDAILFVPHDIIADHDNEIVLFMSSHHGFLHFGYPMHWIGLGEHNDPTRMILRGYWPSLLPLGVLLAGMFYYLAMTFTGGHRNTTLILSAISFLAAGQLLTEVYRGLTPYAYPLHEWRMVLILAFSIGFGATLYLYLINRFVEIKSRGLWAATALIPASTFLITGYDGKSGVAVFTAICLGALVSGYAALKRKPFARLHFAALAVFTGVLVAYPSRFLDVIFFYEIAALLLVLFIAQAITAVKEQKELEKERLQSHQLRLALMQASDTPEDSKIHVNSAGKVEIVSVDEISSLKAAGDYVEIKLDNGKEILHHATLRQMEESLPATFLRVHRSYLVNSSKIKTLTRETSGVGTLTLANESTAPVSRRIMPRVRDLLI